MNTRRFAISVSVAFGVAALVSGIGQSRAQTGSKEAGVVTTTKGRWTTDPDGWITSDDRAAAAIRAAALRAEAANRYSQSKAASAVVGLPKPATATLTTNAIPDYFGTCPNYANSPLPTLNANGTITGGIKKFVDTLPGLGVAGTNDLGQYISVAVADTNAYPGADYYEIALVRYAEKMHTNLPATELQGYVQLETTANSNVSKHVALTYPDGSAILKLNGSQAYAVDNSQYLGPVMVAQRNRPVRVKFTNFLPTGTNGTLFLPVDTTIMGAGMGPSNMVENYTQNRATLHLHGGLTPWISDGTPHQWTAPAGETTSYPKGVSVRYVPDMWFDSLGNRVPAGTAGASNNPGPGSLTFYYTNQQSQRLMFYHDHAYGITRLDVYAGEAAAYILRDPVELALMNGGSIGTTNVTANTIPTNEIPLVIQEKIYVDTNNLVAEDPTWAWGTTPGTPHGGDLWFPHVYMPNQNPIDPMGMNAVGRWDYNTWMYPPQTGQIIGPVPNPLANPAINEPPQNPGTPLPTITPETFCDTPIVNGTAYPTLKVQPTAYRFRILNAANDRTLNLQLYYADPVGATVIRGG
ncbi:MAG: hypothetical protein ABSC38_08105, partial [Verrucomicrobiia bacterium]